MKVRLTFVFLVGFLLSLSSFIFPATAAASTLDLGAPGFDISFPECHRSLPVSPQGNLVVGVNGGRAFTQNPCFASEYRWAASAGYSPSLYMNINYPSGPGLDQAANGPRGTCAPADLSCRAYTYGYNAARYADGYARGNSPGSPRWWLDVETDNYWSPRTDLNAQVIQGAVDYFRNQKQTVGIYSVESMWRKIAGVYAPELPIWVAQTRLSTPILAYCGPNYAFGGGTTLLVQHWDGVKDVDYACPGQSLEVLPVAPASPVPVGPPGGIMPFGTTASGNLIGSSGGTSVSYGFDYAGNNASQTVTVDFSPHDPNVSNHLFVRVTVGGEEAARVHATDTAQPGHLAITFSSHAAGPAVVQLTSYADPNATPAISFWLNR